MNLHPEILNDLAVLYQAGEASQATREMLEREAAANPEFARRLLPPAEDGSKVDVAVPDAQRTALRSINRWNRMYSSFTGAAVALLMLPFSFIYRTRTGELTFFLWRDFPELCLASFVLGIASAVAAVRFRQLRHLD